MPRETAAPPVFGKESERIDSNGRDCNISGLGHIISGGLLSRNGDGGNGKMIIKALMQFGVRPSCFNRSAGRGDDNRF